jgi:hypothetical protein
MASRMNLVRSEAAASRMAPQKGDSASLVGKRGANVMGLRSA